MNGDLGIWAVPLAVLGGALRVSTPFLFVSLGECVTEKSGRINLGLEGTLVFGAMAGYGGSLLTGSPGSGCSSRVSPAWPLACCMVRFARCRGSTTSPSASR